MVNFVTDLFPVAATSAALREVFSAVADGAAAKLRAQNIQHQRFGRGKPFGPR